MPTLFPAARGLVVWLGAVVAVALLLGSPAARADGKADARALYDQGAAAYDAGDYPRAGAMLADADALAPNPTVLRLALGAALKADDAVLSEDLALRADARRVTGELSDLAARAHARFRARVGRVRIVCQGARPCAARLGSFRWLGGEVHAVAPGTVDVVFDEAPEHVRAEVAKGSVTNLVEPAGPASSALPAPPSPGPPVDRTDGGARGLPTVAFWIGAALTAGVGSATIASGIDTQERRNAFLASRTVANQSAGESAVVRTDVLLGGAILTAAATAVVGIFYTRWRSDSVVVSSLSGRIEW